MAAKVAARSACLFASHSYRTAKAVIIRPFTTSSSAPFTYNILLRPTYLSVSGRMISRKSCQRRAATLQEKEEQVGVEDYFHVKTIPNIVEEPTDDDNSSSKELGMVEKWVIKFEQSLNVLLTDSVIKVLDLFYHDRNYARFFVLETIARVPYFAFISVLHMYESFGWWRRADYLKVHFAESWNELHHLLIMEELGGNAFWFDRFLAQHIAIFYYFMTVFMYALSPRMAYHFSECVERHAYSTYDKFIKLQGAGFSLPPAQWKQDNIINHLMVSFLLEELKKLPAPQVAIDYYMNEDLYLFDEFQTSRTPNTRRPKIENLYDVFLNIRDDEGEHCKTMKACQTHGNLQSPHSNMTRRDDDVECSVPSTDCEGFVDCFRKSLTTDK